MYILIFLTYYSFVFFVETLIYQRSFQKLCPNPGFQVRGGYLKKLRRAEGGAKIVGVFRVKNHDFTPKNLIFSNFRGGVRRVRPPPPPPPPLDPPLKSNYKLTGYGRQINLRKGTSG